MTSCHHSVQVQDYLDDLLLESEARGFAAHLKGCALCSAEVALYGRLFQRLDQMPLAEPSHELAERVLDRVLPSRLRWRWVRTLGWGYAASLAVSVAGLAVLLSFPAPRAGVVSLASAASHALIQSGQTLFNLVGFALLQLASGWGLVSAIGERLAPLGRALSTLLAQPGMAVVMWMSVLFCAALLWWMRGGGKRSTKGIRHVGVLGF